MNFRQVKIQSLKSFLTSRTLQATDVFGRRRTVEDLIARILVDLRQHAEEQFGTKIRSAVVGRPVRFVGADREDDNDYAQRRIEDALRIAGFESISFEMEPIAAAYYYESTLDHDELILIGENSFVRLSKDGGQSASTRCSRSAS